MKILKDIQVYCTDGGLGYKQYAYLIRLDKSNNGYDYLCVETININNNDSYILGEIVEDLEDIYIEEINWNIEKSPLINDYLFQFFLNNY